MKQSSKPALLLIVEIIWEVRESPRIEQGAQFNWHLFSDSGLRFNIR